jgi:hypothetical protein
LNVYHNFSNYKLRCILYFLLLLLLLFSYRHLGNDQFLAFGNLTCVYVTSLTGNILGNKPLGCPVCYMPSRHRGEVEMQLYRYLTSAQGGDWWVGGQMPCPGHFIPVKEAWYSLYRRLCGPWGQSRQVWKIMPLPRFKFQTVQ